MMDTTSELIRRLAQLEKWRERQETLEPRRTWLFSQIADVTVSNTAAETTLVGSGVGSLVLPANFFVPGRVVRVTAGGTFSFTANPTIVLRTYFGAAYNYGGTGVMTLAGTIVGTGGWWYQTIMNCRTIGASGTAGYSARVDWDRDVTNGTTQVNVGSASGGLDTTVAITINPVVAIGTANVLNTITCKVLVVEALN